VNHRHDWNRTLFETLTSNRLSRNKYFTQFTNDWYKAVHRRFRVVASLKKEAERLGGIPDTNCWVSASADGLLFHLQSPRLSYKRVVALQPYEWEWLVQQEAIQSLLSANPEAALLGG
jgi:hypothetical protein